MNGIWIFAEQNNGQIAAVAFELLTRALRLAADSGRRITAVTLGHNLAESELQRLIDCGADGVLHASAPPLADFLPQPYAAVLQNLLESHHPDILLAAATTQGRTLLPYVAGRMRAGLTADCTELAIDPDTGLLLQTRPAAGGNIMATIKTPLQRPQMATVRPHSSRPAPSLPGRRGDIRRWTPPAALLASPLRRLHFEPFSEERGVQDAEVVLAVGRGLRKPDHLAVVRAAASELHAAIGASREAVDRGWLPYAAQVGLSGKTVTPKVYLAAGISGAIQHLAGMQTADCIIAVNTDPEAPIFNYARLGIRAELLPFLTALTARLRARRNTAAS